MDINQFDKISKHHMPSQDFKEWQYYLEFITTYFHNRNIQNPIIVELGTAAVNQKYFYQEILNAEYIGIDINLKCHPDIVGNSHDKTVKDKLVKMLHGQNINLLFIDAAHEYDNVKRDYGIYEDLVKNIIVFHDIFHEGSKDTQVRIFWQEIMKEENRYLKIAFSMNPAYMGIGLIIKE